MLPFYRLVRVRGSAREVRLPVGKGITLWPIRKAPPYSEGPLER